MGIEDMSDNELLMESKEAWESLGRHSHRIDADEIAEFRDEVEDLKGEVDFDVDRVLELFEELVERVDDSSSSINRSDLESLGPARDFF
jgi:hypothetical protein